MVIVGGGSSSRFGSDKLMVDIGGRPLISHTVDAVAAHVDVCVVVCRPEVFETIADLPADVTVTTGGATRTLSEMAGLAAIGREVDLIGIHDAARPVLGEETIHRLFDLAHQVGGAVPLLAYDRLILDKKTHQPLPAVHGAQTPQVFRAAELMAAYVRAAQAGFEGHDTVEVMQRFTDVKIAGVEGDPHNIKVTYPRDLEYVRARLSGPSHI
jgi:2-C-methyl-D-erythritol 4-phosphate cytidylyltransferase